MKNQIILSKISVNKCYSAVCNGIKKIIIPTNLFWKLGFIPSHKEVAALFSESGITVENSDLCLNETF